MRRPAQRGRTSAAQRLWSHLLAPSLLASASVVAIGCAPRARMCTSTSECAAESACVAGRCQLEKPNVKPAVESARRLVVRPVDIAYTRSGEGSGNGGLPPVFALGKDGAKLFLRFSAAVPASSTLVEAYVVLRRSTIADEDPVPVHLHATRIIDAWSGGSVAWAFQPRVAETRSPSTVVEPGGSTLVRVDVRDLVRHWSRRDPSDQGIAIVAENETPTGTMFALTALGGTGEGTIVDAPAHVPPSSMGALDVEPYLELYVR